MYRTHEGEDARTIGNMGELSIQGFDMRESRMFERSQSGTSDERNQSCAREEPVNEFHIGLVELMPAAPQYAKKVHNF